MKTTVPKQKKIALSTPSLSRNGIFHLKNYPILKADDERALARRWLEKQDYQAREKLVLSHLRLVAKIAAGYRGYGLNSNDLISEGITGLIRAIDGFKPELGFRLSTYAMWWIKAAMTEYILNSWSIVRTGSASGRKKLFFGLRSLKKRLNITASGDLTPEETENVSRTMGVSKADVIDMNRRLSGGDVSLHTPVGDNHEQEYIDRIPSDALPMEDQILDQLGQEKKKKLLNAAIQELNERERDILTARKIKDEPITLQSLAHRYGISRERVRQIEAGAVRKITKIMSHAVQSLQSQEMGHAS